jgi:hypothetical protein
MQTPTKLMLLLIALELSLPSMSVADSSRDSLKGLRAVAVVVDVSGDNAFKALVRDARLRTVAELKLRQSGLRVLDAVDVGKKRGEALLEFSAYATRACRSAEAEAEPVQYAVALNVSVAQELWSLDEQGKPKMPYFASTWTQNEVLAYGTKVLSEDGLANDVSEAVDTFLNDWLAAHGK